MPNYDLKCPKLTLRVRKFHFFFKLPFFSRDYANTYTYPHTVRFFDPLCLKKALNTFFIKITFFCSLLFPVTPETLPNHHFRQTNDQKWSRKLPKRTKINFLFFIIYITFSLSPYGKKQNHLLFPPFLSPEKGKPQEKTSSTNFFFLLFFLTFLHPTAPRNRKNCHLPFFSKFRLKVP